MDSGGTTAVLLLESVSPTCRRLVDAYNSLRVRESEAPTRPWAHLRVVYYI